MPMDNRNIIAVDRRMTVESNLKNRFVPVTSTSPNISTTKKLNNNFEMKKSRMPTFIFMISNDLPSRDMRGNMNLTDNVADIYAENPIFANAMIYVKNGVLKYIGERINEKIYNASKVKKIRD